MTMYEVICEGSTTHQRAACGTIATCTTESDARMLASAHGLAHGHKCTVQHSGSGPWTRHGHAIPGVTVVPQNPRDRPCAIDAEQIRVTK